MCRFVHLDSPLTRVAWPVVASNRQEEDNPFKLPPDDQIFAIREKERQRRAEEREKVKHQHVWEKLPGAPASRASREGVRRSQQEAERLSICRILREPEDISLPN